MAIETDRYSSETRANSRRLRPADLELLDSIKPNCIVTLKSQQEISALTMEGKATRFFNRVQRAARGRDWATYDSDKWPLAIGYIEELLGSPRWHLDVQAELDIRKILADGGPIWRDLVPGGHYHYDYLEHPTRYAEYITKRFSRQRDHVLVYVRDRMADRSIK